jgi:cytochrome P450
MVTRMADVRDVLERWAVFTVRPYAPKMDPVVGPFMLGRDDTEINQRDKGLMLAVLSRRDLPAVRETVGSLCEQAIAKDRVAGAVEVVGRLGRGVALGLCATYFGFPGPEPRPWRAGRGRRSTTCSTTSRTIRRSTRRTSPPAGRCGATSPS